MLLRFKVLPIWFSFPVSFGSTASLFFGGSILSIVELIYFLFLREICSLRKYAKRRRKSRQVGNLVQKQQSVQRKHDRREALRRRLERIRNPYHRAYDYTARLAWVDYPGDESKRANLDYCLKSR